MYNHNPRPQRPDESSDHDVSYEEIMDILSKRHNYDSIGDNDIM